MRDAKRFVHAHVTEQNSTLQQSALAGGECRRHPQNRRTAAASSPHNNHCRIRLFGLGTEVGSLELLHAVLALLERQALLAKVLLLGRLLGRGLVRGVRADLVVGSLVQVLDLVGSDASLDVLGKLALVRLLVFLGELGHEVGDVLAKDAVAVGLGIVGLLLPVESGEALGRVGNVNTTIDGTLEGTEDTGTGRGARKTNVEESAEGALVAVSSHVVLLASDLLDTLVGIGEVQLGEDAAGEEEARGVRSSVVGKTNRDAKAGELGRVGSRKNDITLDLGIGDLADDRLVGEADDKAVLGRVVLVLVLDNQALAGIVVRLALSATTVLDLVALEVRLVLHNLDERHFRSDTLSSLGLKVLGTPTATMRG
eukprot:Opistho-2@47464